jgi:hypothetical protein
MQGSLNNFLMGHSKQTEPEVGMGCTILRYTDRDAATIIEVNSKKTVIVIQEDNATRIDKNGMSECQDYAYTPNTDATKLTFTKRKNGAWVRMKEPLQGGQRVAIGYRDSYHDYSF